MDSQASSSTSTDPSLPPGAVDDDELAAESHRSKTATTRIAFLDIPTTEHALSKIDIVTQLHGRGYNTFVWPLLKNGRLTADFPTTSRASSQELDGMLIKAMHKGRKISPQTDRAKERISLQSSDTVALYPEDEGDSHWILIDPLRASPPRSTELSSFARRHRQWLMRNTSSASYPVGERGVSPLFSWINPDYRRRLGDILVALAETQTFESFVIDLRAYPIRSADPARWYCCSYESQERAARELGISFDHLISEGTRADIHRWQRWIYNELTTMIRYIKSRVRVARYDIYWKVLVNYENPHDPECSPWVSWLSKGLVEEVLVEFDSENLNPTTIMQQIDVASGRRGLIVPLYENEQHVSDHWAALSSTCTTGYGVLNPDPNAPTSLPQFPSVWEYSGALEDNPHQTAVSLCKFLCSIFPHESSEGRYYRRLQRALENLTPEPEKVGKLLGRVAKLEKRLDNMKAHLDQDKRTYEREMELLLRILPTIRMIPEAY